MANTILNVLTNPGLVLVVIATLLAFVGLSLWDWLISRETNTLLTAISRSSYRLVHSGLEGDHFFDADLFLGVPENINRFSAWFTGAIEAGDVDYLAFIEKAEGPVGTLTSKDLLSAQTGIPAFVVRPRRRLLSNTIKGARIRSEGIVKPGDRVVIVSDVVTTGGTLLEAIKLLEAKRAKVKQAIALYDREDEGFEQSEFDKRGIRIKTMIRKSELEASTGEQLERSRKKGVVS
jgi:orotate phosphoribosyltransferase